MAAPAFRAVGGRVVAAGDATPSAPAGLTVNDVELMLNFSFNEPSSLLIANGFALLGASDGQDPYAIKRVGTEIVSGRDIDMLMHFFKACVSGTAASYVRLRNLVPLVVSRPNRSDYTKH